MAIVLSLAGIGGLNIGCSRAALPIAVFAAAAAVHTVQSVDAYCSQEGVDCTKSSPPRQLRYEAHEEPYSAGVDW